MSAALSDRELLELAAKSAGLNLECFHNDVLGWELWNGDCWNPLTDDGDALRLAVKLDMSIDVEAHEQSTYVYAGFVAPRAYAMEMWGEDKAAATRRAIVRAAAALSSTSHGQGSASDGGQR